MTKDKKAIIIDIKAPSLFTLPVQHQYTKYLNG